MPVMPPDYMADVLRIDLAHLGCSRIILLGAAEEMASGGLRTALARWGLQVLIPPEDERAWISELCEQVQGDISIPGEDVDRMRALLADGMEHGVEAIVTTNARLAEYVRACDLGVPTVVSHPRGSVVPVRNVVFDMGGVLFAWDPLAMARRVCANEDDARLLASTVFGSVEWAWQDAGAVDERTVLWTSKLRTPRRLHACVEKLVMQWHNHRVPIEGMEELIRDLKNAGFNIYLLSNAGTSFAQYESQLPARACFDGMVVSCYEHVVKPDARIYQTLLNRYGLDAKTCLFVDDTQLNVLGARRVGMRAYHFQEGANALRALLLGE